MWRCHKCGKPVYFAERRQSIGFDWHPWCLKCEECGKRLNPGQHAEHKSTPYCHIPCYSALFGPKLFGHGSRVESHRSFGQRSVSFIREANTLQKRIHEYNDFIEKQDGPRMEVSYREVNGRLVLEGVLRVYWGVHHSIRLRQFDDKRLNSKKAQLERERKCKSMVSDFSKFELEVIAKKELEDESSNSDDNTEAQGNGSEPKMAASGSSKSTSPDVYCMTLPGKMRDDTPSPLLSFETNATLDRDLNPLQPNNPLTDTGVPSRNLDRAEGSLDIPEDTTAKDVSTIDRFFESRKNCADNDQKSSGPSSLPPFNNPNDNNHERVRGKGPRALRRRHGKKMDRSKIKRKSSMNGHWYDRDTSVFTPPKGSSMSVHVTSLLPTTDVVKMLLEKYQVESDFHEFALYVVKDNGERRLVKDHEFPLLLRVNLGPRESVAKLFLMDKGSTNEIKPDVAQYLRFSYAECRAILNKFYEEEEFEVAKIQIKYKFMKKKIRELMFDARMQRQY